MPAENSVRLVKEAHRCLRDLQLQSGHIYSNSENQEQAYFTPYAEDGVRKVLKDVRSIHEEISKFQEASNTVTRDNLPSDTKIEILSTFQQRNKQSLCIYHLQRVRLLRRQFWRNSRGFSRQNNTTNLNAPESLFIQKHGEANVNYMNSFKELDLRASLVPPKDLFCQVRVLKECGEVEIENGSIFLSKNSHHYLRRADVEHLIEKGFLAVI